MGRTFKENCPDTRNSGVADIIDTLLPYHCNIDVYDPWVEDHNTEHLVAQPETNCYDAIIVAVAHDEFRKLGIVEIRKFAKPKSVIFDVKHIFESSEVDGSL